MQVINGKFVLEMEPCGCASHPVLKPGTVYKTYACIDRKTFSYCIKARCPNNKTGKRGNTHDVKPSDIVTCGNCNGTGEVMEDVCSYVPFSLLDNVPVRVIRSNHRQSFAEAYLGVGLWSSTDYGRHKAQTDEELINQVREAKSFQPIKVVKKLPELEKYVSRYDLTLPKAIVILCNDNGYSVLAEYAKEENASLV